MTDRASAITFTFSQQVLEGQRWCVLPLLLKGEFLNVSKSAISPSKFGGRGKRQLAWESKRQRPKTWEETVAYASGPNDRIIWGHAHVSR